MTSIFSLYFILDEIEYSTNEFKHYIINSTSLICFTNEILKSRYKFDKLREFVYCLESFFQEGYF